MAYKITETNVLREQGYYTSVFTLDDDAGIMPQVILDKNFTEDENLNIVLSNAKIIDSLLWENNFLMDQSNG